MYGANIAIAKTRVVP